MCTALDVVSALNRVEQWGPMYDEPVSEVREPGPEALTPCLGRRACPTRELARRAR